MAAPPSNSASPIRTLVVARTDRLGDVVISSSCLGAVRGHFPGARVHWLVAGRMRPLFCEHPLLDGVLTTGAGGFWTRVLRLTRTFRDLSADAIVLLQPDSAVETAAWLARVPVRAGWARRRWWPQFLTRSIPYGKSEGTKHEARYNFDVLGLLGVPEPALLEPLLRPDPAARGRLEARLGADAAALPGCAALHLAAHGAKPRAPLEVLAGLAGWLRRERGLRPLLVGTERDPPAAMVAQAAGLDPAELIDLRGVTDMAELAWLLGSVALCAARDSGPAQLAAAMGCRTLVFFVDPRPILGPTRWKPLGTRVEILPAEPASFTPAAAQAAAARLLAG
jgi:ADP-heptose:LPS heptosyltransferase